MPFAAVDFLARIVAPLAANFGGPHTLAVDNRGTGSPLAPFGVPEFLAELVVNRLPHAVQSPLPKQIVHCSPLWTIVGQLTPLTACAVHVQNGVNHLSSTDLARSSS